VNANERFEIIGELYARRFGYLRPGKDQSAASGLDSMSAENVERFHKWFGSPDAFEDALACIGRLNEYITSLEAQL
jgi:hypothetical protein